MLKIDISVKFPVTNIFHRPTLPKIFRPVARNTLIFHCYSMLSYKYGSRDPKVVFSLLRIPYYKTGQSQGSIYRGSYMSAHVLLNLLNELGKRDKMRGLLKEFATSLINSIIQEHEC